MLKDKFVKEQAISAKVIWLLSFDKDVREKIKSFDGMMECLEDLQKSQNDKVGKYVNGALFVLKEQNDVSKRMLYNNIFQKIFIYCKFQIKIFKKDLENVNMHKHFTSE